MVQSLSIVSSRRWRIIGWSFAALLLVLPAIAMQFTSEMNWGREDFTALGLMLLVAGIGFELAFRFVREKTHRWMVAAALVGLFLLVWVQLAVGLF